MEHPVVIFDLDGTLVDSLVDIGTAMNHAVGSLGFSPHSFDAYREMIGEGLETLARRALPEGQEQLVPGCVARFRAYYADHAVDFTRPYPGIPELVERLRAQGRRLAVLSNKREDFTQQVVRALFPSAPFLVVRGERAGVPRKPDPTSALDIARGFGVSPEACIFVGDTRIDMLTATGAGMLPVGALWGTRTRAELEAAGARTLLTHPLELLPAG